MCGLESCGQDRGWTTNKSWSYPLYRQETCIFSELLQDCSGAWSTPYSMGIWNYFSGDKATGACGWPFTSSAVITNDRSYMSTAQYVFMACTDLSSCLYHIPLWRDKHVNAANPWRLCTDQSQRLEPSHCVNKRRWTVPAEIRTTYRRVIQARRLTFFCETALFITACKTARRKTIAKNGEGTSSETVVAYLNQKNYTAVHTEWLRKLPINLTTANFLAHILVACTVCTWHLTAMLICCDNIHLFKSKDAITIRNTLRSIRHDVLYACSLYYFLPVVWSVANSGQTVPKLNIGLCILTFRHRASCI